MLNKFKQGFKSGLMVFLGVCVSGLFAYTVTGTIKTWTTGDTLTATDLNTTVQSLKTAVESASQKAEASVQGGATATNFETFLGSLGSTTEKTTTMTRSGTVSNASVVIASNTVGQNCTVTLRKNSADTLIQFSIPSGSTTTVTDSDTVSFVANDVLSWRTACTSGISSNLYASVHMEF